MCGHDSLGSTVIKDFLKGCWAVRLVTLGSEKFQNQETNLYHKRPVVHFSLFSPSYLIHAYNFNFFLCTNNPQIFISSSHVSPEWSDLYLQMLAEYLPLISHENLKSNTSQNKITIYWASSFHCNILSASNRILFLNSSTWPIQSKPEIQSHRDASLLPMPQMQRQHASRPSHHAPSALSVMSFHCFYPVNSHQPGSIQAATLSVPTPRLLSRA